MTKSGTITQIVPDGGYQCANGYINTFQMTIQCSDGTFVGQIGSKSQTYPIAVGQQISVEMTNTEHGVRFKKFNPQYAGGQQGAPQGRQGQKPDASRDLAIKRGNALNAVFSATTISSDLIGDYLVASMGWLNNGVWNLLPPNVKPEPWDGESSAPTDDDIAF